jgi:hypothetical protein
METTISNNIIRKFKPCYDPSDVIKDENEELPIKDWVQKYRNVVPAKDIIWLLLRKEFLSEKDLRLFAVWCAREALKLVENPDERSVNACNVAERYANGEATKEELFAARKAASNATSNATNTDYSFVYHAYYAAFYAAYAVVHPAYMAASSASESAHASYAVRDVDSEAVRDAAANAARSAQIDQLLTYFE